VSNSLLDQLVTELTRLPGIGAKSAERLAHHLLKVPGREALALADAIRVVKEGLRPCQNCHHIAEAELCDICQDETRNRRQVCVVEQSRDVWAIEESGAYRGVYHVLGGTFSPLENRGPETLTLGALATRVREGGVDEVIVATNADFEGDGTALLVSEALASSAVTVSRLARGVPAGSHLEYMNKSIISDALEGRRSFETGGESRQDEMP